MGISLPRRRETGPQEGKARHEHCFTAIQRLYRSTVIFCKLFISIRLDVFFQFYIENSGFSNFPEDEAAGFGEMPTRFCAHPSNSNCAPEEGNYLQRVIPGYGIFVWFERARF